MTDPMAPEAVYLRLGSLIAEPPDFNAVPTASTHRWVARALALIEAGNLLDLSSLIAFKVAAQHLDSVLGTQNGTRILALTHQALAKAELAAPDDLQGAFIAAGNTFDAFSSVAKVLSAARADVFIVDPWADAKLVGDYAVLALDNVTIRILCHATYRRSLKQATEHWAGQTKQALEVRFSPDGTLHDRTIIIDRTTAYSIGQSFNHLAKRAHTTLVRMPQELGKLEVDACEAMWSAATPL
jgi:hypothetical protein